MSATLADLGLEAIHTGKVRALYALGADRLLMVASDRISAFDVVMAEPIPDKGRVLTAMTAFWCEELGDAARGSLLSCDPAVIDAAVPGFAGLEDLHGATMLVRRAEMLPLECIVRGYLAGQAWEEYREHGTIHHMAAPEGLDLASRLPSPMFTPSTKADEGHDENIDLATAAGIVGEARLAEAATLCLDLFAAASARAAAAGLILADTKFELGIIDGRLGMCESRFDPQVNGWFQTPVPSTLGGAAQHGLGMLERKVVIGISVHDQQRNGCDESRRLLGRIGQNLVLPIADVNMRS